MTDVGEELRFQLIGTGGFWLQGKLVSCFGLVAPLQLSYRREHSFPYVYCE